MVLLRKRTREDVELIQEKKNSLLLLVPLDGYEDLRNLRPQGRRLEVNRLNPLPSPSVKSLDSTKES